MHLLWERNPTYFFPNYDKFQGTQWSYLPRQTPCQEAGWNRKVDQPGGPPDHFSVCKSGKHQQLKRREMQTHNRLIKVSVIQNTDLLKSWNIAIFFIFWYASNGFFPQIKHPNIWIITQSKFSLAKLLAVFFAAEFQIRCALQNILGERHGGQKRGRETDVQARLQLFPSPCMLSGVPSFTSCCWSPFGFAASLGAGCLGAAAEQLWAAAGGSLPGCFYHSPSLLAL